MKASFGISGLDQTLALKLSTLIDGLMMMAFFNDFSMSFQFFCNEPN